jgi:ribose transport system substrate-binding protein
MSLSSSKLARLAVASLFVVTSACAKEKPAGGDSGSAGAAPATGQTFTIAMIAKSSTNPVFLSGQKGAEAAAAELTKSTGVTVKIDWLTPPNEDGAVQAQRIARR